jgi:solute carrier family 25 carnitine/acylcarnitine transporter 20/29
MKKQQEKTHPFFSSSLKKKKKTHDDAAGVIDCVRKTLAWEGVGGLYKGVTSPLAGQMVFRATLFGAFGESKRWLSEGGTKALTPLQYFQAGAMTGCVAAFAEAPIDFYKSQMQVQVVRSRSNPDYKMPYSSVGDCVRATLRESGARGPFQGLGVTLVRNTPANAVYLGSFEVIKNKMTEHYKLASPADLPAPAVVAAAGIGGLLYWLAIFPVDVVKSAVQSDSIVRSERKYAGPLKAAGALWREGGVSRFYRGFTPCLLRAVPANGVMLLTVDRVTAMLNRKKEEESSPGSAVVEAVTAAR